MLINGNENETNADADAATNTSISLEKWDGTWEDSLLPSPGILTEQTTPVAGTLRDSVASVSNITFFDEDLDLGQIGGVVEWHPPEDVDQVTEYFFKPS